MNAMLKRVLPLMTPWVFVLIWSTGFIVARLGMPHAPPLTFLSLRFVGAIVCLFLLVIWFKAAWPRREQLLPVALAGLLMQGGYLGGVWWAVSLGLPAGLSALVVGLQPLLTGVFAGVFGRISGETVTPLQWFGLLLGFLGVVVTVSSRWSADQLNWHSMVLILFALFSITIGTLIQKFRCGKFDMRTGAIVQYGASAIVSIPLALMLEWPARIELTGELYFAYGWSVLALSIGALALLFWLIENGEATRVTSLFYLSPPTTAILAWFIFHEQLDLTAIAGMVITVFAVALVNRKS